MKEWDPSGKQGPKQPMPDLVTVLQPKDEEPISDKPTIGAFHSFRALTLQVAGCHLWRHEPRPRALQGAWGWP